MKVIAALVVMAGMLCATHAANIGGIESEREAYFRRLGSCPQDELREELDTKLKNSDILGVWEIMQREEVYSRIEYGEMDGYFAMLGMILTDKMRHFGYARALEKSKVDMGRDGGMVEKLVREMATGAIWTELNEELVETAVKKLEENCDDARRARGEDVKPSVVVDHIARKIKKRLPPADRSWGRVLETLLKNDEVRTEIMGGKCTKDLMKMIDENEELEDVVYEHALGWRSMLGAMKDKVLAGRMIANGIGQGCWLHVHGLERAMRMEEVRELFSKDDMFKSIRERYGLKEEELSMGRLKELVQEGRLDDLVERAVRRLIRHGKIYNLRSLIENVGGRFVELLSGGELDGALKEGTKELTRYGRVYDLELLIKTVERRFDELLSTGGLCVVLREGMSELVESGDVYDLIRLLETMKGKFCKLVSSGELDAVLEEGINRLVKSGDMGGLRWLLEGAANKEIFDRLLSGRKLDASLREGIESLIRWGHIDNLKELIVTMGGRREVFEGMLRSGRLDEVLKKGIELLIRRGYEFYLKDLVEILGRRLFYRLLSSLELSQALKEGAEELFGIGDVDSLRKLIEIVEGGEVFEELLDGGELDTALRRGIERLIGDGCGDTLRKLIGAVERGRVFDELLSGGELDAVLKEGLEKLVRGGKVDKLEALIKAVDRRVFDRLLSRGDLDVVLEEETKKLIEDGKIDDLKTLIVVVEERVSEGFLDRALKEGIEYLISGVGILFRTHISSLRGLIGIEVVKGRLSDGLLDVGELDEVFGGMAEKVMRRDSTMLYWGHGLVAAVEEGLFDGLVSVEELGRLKEKSILQKFCSIV